MEIGGFAFPQGPHPDMSNFNSGPIALGHRATRRIRTPESCSILFSGPMRLLVNIEPRGPLFLVFSDLMTVRTEDDTLSNLFTKALI
jgi:hypothetical protein